MVRGSGGKSSSPSHSGVSPLSGYVVISGTISAESVIYKYRYDFLNTISQTHPNNDIWI